MAYPDDDKINAIIGVNSQPKPMLRKDRNLMECTPRTSPMPIIAPIVACEVLTGTPIKAKICIVVAIEETVTKAVKASKGMIPLPTAIITRLL